jgi:hypothetical protein
MRVAELTVPKDVVGPSVDRVERRMDDEKEERQSPAPEPAERGRAWFAGGVGSISHDRTLAC